MTRRSTRRAPATGAASLSIALGLIIASVAAGSAPAQTSPASGATSNASGSGGNGGAASTPPGGYGAGSISGGSYGGGALGQGPGGQGLGGQTSDSQSSSGDGHAQGPTSAGPTPVTSGAAPGDDASAPDMATQARRFAAQRMRYFGWCQVEDLGAANPTTYVSSLITLSATVERSQVSRQFIQYVRAVFDPTLDISRNSAVCIWSRDNTQKATSSLDAYRFSNVVNDVRVSDTGWRPTAPRLGATGRPTDEAEGALR